MKLSHTEQRSIFFTEYLKRAILYYPEIDVSLVVKILTYDKELTEQQRTQFAYLMGVMGHEGPQP